MNTRTTVPAPRSRKPRRKPLPPAAAEECVFTVEMPVSVRFRAKARKMEEIIGILNGVLRRRETVVRTIDGIDLVLVRK